MFHPDTHTLIDLWAGAAEASGCMPPRALLPEALGTRLPRLILIGGLADQPHLRIAGGWLEALHGHDLKDAGLFDLWRDNSATLVAATLLRTVRDRTPMIIVAEIGERAQRLELGLVPLIGPHGEIDRILGLFSPLKPIELAAKDSPRLTARLSLGADQTRAITTARARRPAA